MDAEMHSGRYCPFPRQGLKPHERPQTDSRITQGMGMKPGYTGYIPGEKIWLFWILYFLPWFKDHGTSLQKLMVKSPSKRSTAIINIRLLRVTTMYKSAYFVLELVFYIV